VNYYKISPLFLPAPPPGADIAPTISVHSISSTTGEFSAVFQAPKDGQISGVYFRTSNVTVGCTLDVRLEKLDLSSGIPTGELASPFSNASVVIQNTDDNIGFPITFSGAASVSKGDWLAMRLDVLSGTPSTLSISAFTDGDLLFGPYVILNNVLAATSPIFSTLYSDGAYETPIGCYPIATTTTHTFNSGSNPNTIGNIVNLPYPSKTIGAWAWLDADSDAIIGLYSGDGATLLSSGQIKTNIPPTANAGLHYVEFPSSVPLSANENYYVALKPATASNVSLFSTNALNLKLGSGLLNPHFKLCSAREPSNPSSWTVTGSGKAFMGLIIDEIGYESASVQNIPDSFYASFS